MSPARTDDVVFQGSCSPISLPCDLGNFYVNPCNCTSYHECHSIYDPPLLRHCAPGTAWNDKKQYCDYENSVYYSRICIQEEPWTRCKRIDDLSDDEVGDIKGECLKTNDNILKGGSTGSTGAIVGGVFGGLIAVALIVFIVLYIKRVGKPKCLRKLVSAKTPIDNPAYSEPYELYDTIDVTKMNDSGISKNTAKPPVPERPIETLPSDDIPAATGSTTSSVTHRGGTPTGADYDNSSEIRRSYSPLIVHRNSEIESAYKPLGQPSKHLPSEYSRPYMEPSRKSLESPSRISLDCRDMDSRSNFDEPASTPTTIPDYVDFGHYDSDYSLATSQTNQTN